MYPSKHIVFGFIFALLVFILFPQIELLGFFTIWLASFLIDVDHYLYYVLAKKDLSLRKAYKWFMGESAKSLLLPREKRKEINKEMPCIFHGIETIIILILLSFVNNFFLFVLIGFVFHEFLDFIHVVYYGFSLKHIGSQIYNLVSYFRK
ncbi:MAG: hypothetical protein AABW91_03530 [Nanoarchaeota archaeon]